MIISVNEIPPEVPVGTILSWVLRVDNDGGEIVDLPDGWMRCDGSVIPHGSIWTGKNVPNLNGERRFLRGGNDADMLKLEDDQLLQHEHIFSDPGHSHSYVDTFTYDNNIDGYDGPPEAPDHRNDRYDYKQTRDITSKSTGISVTGVASAYRHGEENRPKNMGIIWIIRVW